MENNFLSLNDMKNIKEIKNKKKATENMVVFSLLLSLEIKEKNKREKERKGCYALILCNFFIPSHVYVSFYIFYILILYEIRKKIIY